MIKNNVFLLSLIATVWVYPSHARCHNFVNQEKPSTTRQVDQANSQSNSSDRKQSGVLIGADWLATHLGDPDVRLFGLGQSLAQYKLAHIPNEFFLDWKTDITDPKQMDRYNLPTEKQLADLLGNAGVTADTTIVLTDNMKSRLSTRMFWTLRCYGHKKINILDGGRKSWIRSGRSFVKEIPKAEPVTYQVQNVDRSLRANLELVKSQIGNDKTLIIDGRPAKQFSGEEPGKAFHTNKPHKRRGHIVSAKNIAWPDNFNEDGTFKSPDELQKLYSAAGTTPDKSVVTYCNEGLHAAAPWFVLTEILDFDNVRLYDDSLVEWANRNDTPMESAADHDK